MTEDWQVGDLALCVDTHTPTVDGFTPTKIVEGESYRVYGVGVDPDGSVGLFLDEAESEGYAGGYLAFRFVKVPPSSDEDEQVILLLRETSDA